MKLDQEIEMARQEATRAKLEGRAPERAQERLRELYRIPRRKAKRAKINIL